LEKEAWVGSWARFDFEEWIAIADEGTILCRETRQHPGLGRPDRQNNGSNPDEAKRVTGHDLARQRE
jgi:hypothetical protein